MIFKISGWYDHMIWKCYLWFLLVTMLQVLLILLCLPLTFPMSSRMAAREAPWEPLGCPERCLESQSPCVRTAGGAYSWGHSEEQKVPITRGKDDLKKKKPVQINELKSQSIHTDWGWLKFGNKGWRRAQMTSLRAETQIQESLVWISYF